MDKSIKTVISKIEKEKKWRKLFFSGLWMGIIFTVLFDVFQIGWCACHFHVTLTEMVFIDDFLAGSLATTTQHPGYLIAVSIRLRFMIFKLIAGIILAGVFGEYFKCQDVAVSLYQTLENNKETP
jgi:hypothetical protein